MIHLSGHIDVPAPKRDDVAAHLADHIALTRAEPGCVSFEVCPDPAITGRYSVRETFTDRAAFKAHQARTKASNWGAYTAGFPRTYKVVTTA